MYQRNTFIYLSLLFTFATTAFADLDFSTSFSAAEGYLSGGIDKQIQQAAPYFVEGASVRGGLYFPRSRNYEMGILRRDPNSRGARALLQKGAGEGFDVGSTWSARIVYTFEGLPAMVMGGKVPTMLGGVGFSNAKNKAIEIVYAGIQKTPQHSESYQFYVFGKSGGGFFSKNVNYASIGDDTSDADDLSDKLEIEFTLTKSSKAGVLSFEAALRNMDKRSTLATLSGDLKVPHLYDEDLYAYVSSGAVVEEANYDLFNLHALSSKAEAK